ncbi:hypothetical protein TPA0910_80180 [Streptomyces hygroscopicus subsp. sporocinereus]|uniref:Uncharacterized protein n=1 Tax=Streptomyces hygroscopicus TaxID=1912 RepID=A0ABQ3UDA5_STRHY|nr:hypothetical protein TPA0910_80180 [Streptomyces hygroscopicus]
MLLTWGDGTCMVSSSLEGRLHSSGEEAYRAIPCGRVEGDGRGVVTQASAVLPGAGVEATIRTSGFSTGLNASRGPAKTAGQAPDPVPQRPRQPVGHTQQRHRRPQVRFEHLLAVRQGHRTGELGMRARPQFVIDWSQQP